MISTIFGGLTALFGSNETFSGYDAVLADLYERADMNRSETTVGILDPEGVDRLSNPGVFDNTVEIQLEFDLGRYGPVPFTFPMPRDPTDEDEEFNQFLVELGFDSFDTFMADVSSDGVAVNFTRRGGEWRPDDRIRDE